MNAPAKFQRLSDIASELNAKIADLQGGNLTITELEQLTNQSRELYERLVVLRFKAYSAEVNGTAEVKMEETTSAPVAVASTPVIELNPAPVVETPAAVVEEEKEPENTFIFKVSEEKPTPVETPQPVQVNLIDAIEEVTKAEVPAFEIETKSTEDVTVFDTPAFSSEPVVNTTAKNTLFSAQESLHEKLAKTVSAPESIATKLESTPIADLKKAISLNQRFQFSKELFKGNNQDYEVAIDKLNSATRDEAMKHLDNLRSKYSWQNESPVAANFIELVERRYAH
jgi:hypothetical protein